MKKILFLTNNENTQYLLDWLTSKESNVIKMSKMVTLEMLDQIQPEWIICYNYKFIIKKDIINQYKNRIINLHMSLLPYNRGSYPNFWSFVDNTPKGVSILQVDEGLDTGDLLVSKPVFFDEAIETFETSYKKLNEELVRLFIENWDKIKIDAIVPQKQEGTVTFHKDSDFKSYVGQFENFNWSWSIAYFKKEKEKNINNEKNRN